MRKIIILSVISGILLTVAAAAYSEKVQSSIASEVIRLHVLANSNSGADQALKLKVRDRVLKESKNLFKNCKSRKECERIINENMPNILAAAEDEVLKNGYSYTVSASKGNYFFPMKTYNGFSLPAGKYDAVKIEIGAAKGNNWWCVMFPPLCFVDATFDKGMLSSLSEEELSVISSAEGVNIKFKIVDFFQNSIHKVKTAFK